MVDPSHYTAVPSPCPDLPPPPHQTDLTPAESKPRTAQVRGMWGTFPSRVVRPRGRWSSEWVLCGSRRSPCLRSMLDAGQLSREYRTPWWQPSSTMPHCQAP